MGKNFHYFAVFAMAAMLSASIVTSAFARDDARRMSCRQVHKLIKKRGAVVLTTGRYTYERYVRDYSYCDYREFTRWVVISTRDKRNCRVKLCDDTDWFPFWDD